MSALLPRRETTATERNKDLDQIQDGTPFFLSCYGLALPGGPGLGFCLSTSLDRFTPREGEDIVSIGRGDLKSVTTLNSRS